MRKTVVLLFTVLFFSFGCSDLDDNLNVQIRVDNRTDLKLTQVSIDDLEFIDIDSGSKTAYKVKEDFLSPIQLTIVSDSLMTTLAINNIQQDTLQPGRYTYKINTFSDNEDLQYEVVKD